MARRVDAGLPVWEVQVEGLALLDVSEDLAEGGLHAEASTSLFLHLYLQQSSEHLAVASVSSSGYVPRHSMHALALSRRVAELWDPSVDGLRHPAELVGVGFALLPQATLGQPLIEGLGLHELLVPPPEKRIEIVARIHPAKLAQHLRLVATLERHHPFPLHFNRVSREEFQRGGLVHRSEFLSFSFPVFECLYLENIFPWSLGFP